MSSNTAAPGAVPHRKTSKPAGLDLADKQGLLFSTWLLPTRINNVGAIFFMPRQLHVLSDTGFRSVGRTAVHSAWWPDCQAELMGWAADGAGQVCRPSQLRGP